MSIDLTNFRNVLDNLMTDIKSLYQEKISAAENAKDIINEQIEVLNGVSNDVSDIADMMNDFAADFDEAADKFDNFGVHVSNIVQRLDAGIPEGNIDTFVGFCSVCGDELHVEDKPYISPDKKQMVCVDCHEEESEDDKG